jgi:hypothetical protein
MMITLITLAIIGWLINLTFGIKTIVDGWRNKDKEIFDLGISVTVIGLIFGLVTGWVLLGGMIKEKYINKRLISMTMINLDTLRDKLDNMLNQETADSLNEWINNKRNMNEEQIARVELMGVLDDIQSIMHDLALSEIDELIDELTHLYERFITSLTRNGDKQVTIWISKDIDICIVCDKPMV